MFLRVTVIQRETATLAEGNALITCTEALQIWEIDAATRNGELLQPGAAAIVATARSTRNGEDTDSQQWLATIALVQE